MEEHYAGYYVSDSPGFFFCLFSLAERRAVRESNGGTALMPAEEVGGAAAGAGGTCSLTAVQKGGG